MNRPEGRKNVASAEGRGFRVLLNPAPEGRKIILINLSVLRAYSFTPLKKSPRSDFNKQDCADTY
jgi:hypothetical protein